jgi:hypothetical protein
MIASSVSVFTVTMVRILIPGLLSTHGAEPAERR